MSVKKSNCGRPAGKTLSKEKLSYFLSGFAEGEGSFNVSVINRKQDYKHGWKVSLSFNISQKDDTVPKLFKEFLECGKIRYRKDGICYYEVRSLEEISEVVIPFFEEYSFISESAQKRFELFCKIATLMEKERHLDKEGMKQILQLRDKMKVGRERKYTNEEILSSY